MPVGSGGSCPPPESLCYDSFRRVVTPGPVWETYTLYWSDFSQAGWGHTAPVGYQPQLEILALYFGITDRSYLHDVWIDDVAFF